MKPPFQAGVPAPFVDLPAALVEDVLGQTTVVARELLTSFGSVRKERETMRKQLEQSGLLTTESALGYPPLPTTCAADGSYAIERLLTTDLAAAAAVAVEGLAPPSETRHWPVPRHESFIAAEPHHEDTATVLRAVMLGEELRLLTEAPHDLLLFDGTLTLPIIYFNQALGKARDLLQLRSARRFIEKCSSYLSAYLNILRSERSDRHFAGLPKYSTRRELGDRLRWPETYDDRGLLTLLLNAGELTRPFPLEAPDSPWHLNARRLPDDVRPDVEVLAGEIEASLGNVHVFYLKPQEWLPALRVEISASVAANTHRLSTVIQGIRHQTATPSMLEPYPIYLADRTAKALARAIPAFRQVTTQRVAESYGGDIGEVFFAMHGYRSESGR